MMYVQGSQQDSADISYDVAEYEKYISWVKDQEGDGARFRSRIYKDARGKETVGYGHTGDMIDKLKVRGQSLFGISKKEADTLLRSDLDSHFNTLRQRMANIGRLESFDTLDPNAKHMLLDYEFNLGDINAYPLLRDAVLAGDWDTASQEYKRSYTDKKTGDVKPLTKRNEGTYDFFLEDRFESGESLTEDEYYYYTESTEID